MNLLSPSGHPLLDRRHFLAHTVSGLAGIAMLDLLGRHNKLRRRPGTGRAPIRPRIDPAHPLRRGTRISRPGPNRCS